MHHPTDRIAHTTAFVTPVVEHWLNQSDDPWHHEHMPQHAERRKEGNVLLNDALNTFYLRLYGFKHMVKDRSDSERRNPLLPHGLLFSISSNGSFICTIPQTG